MVGFGYVEVVVAHSGDVVAVFGAIAELRRKNDWPGIFYRCGALMSWSSEATVTFTSVEFTKATA